MSNRLSVCLLTRNEEANIERVIRSVQDLADEIIVADTGSRDGTVDRARALGARIISHAWDDDFSAGRNDAIRNATGDWILWINPDEEWLSPSADEVRRLIGRDDPRVFGYLARIQSIPREKRLDQFSETWDLRLYQRRPDLNYVGRLHPTFAPEVSRAVALEGKEVRPSEIVIRHSAYRSRLDPTKIRWAIRLLERELQERPAQLHYLAEYGRNLLLLNDPQGHQVMADAITLIEPSFGAPHPPHPHAQILLEYALTTPAEHNRSRLSSAQAQSLALQWFPNSPPLLWTIAESFFRLKQFPAAVVLLEHLVQLGKTGAYDHSLTFDPRIIGAWALLNLGQCYRALGRTSDAVRCFEELENDPDVQDQARQQLSQLANS